MSIKRRQYSFEFKKNFIDQVLKHQNVEKVCKELGMPVGTGHKWYRIYREKGIDELRDKSRRPNNQPKKTSQWVIDKIVKKKKENPEMGSKAMSEHLERFESIKLSPRTIGKVFKKNNLPDGDCGYHQNSYEVKGNPSKKLEKTLETELKEWERFARENPNEMWQMDIKDFYIRDAKRVYLITALDDCSRFVVNWGLFRSPTAENVLEVLRGGLAKHGAPDEILTDQGVQFKHWKGVTQFEKLLKKVGVKHTKARSHHPQTCGKIEAFHKTLHREIIDKEYFTTHESATEKISRYIEHYNYGRAHSSLNGFTPSDRYFGVIESVKKYLSDMKEPINDLEKANSSTPIAKKSNLYLIGKILKHDVRIQENGGVFSVYVNNKLFKDINLIHSVQNNNLV